MTKLPRDVSGQACVKALAEVGFVFHQQTGSHIVVVCRDPRARIAPGMLRSIIRDAGLTVDGFVALL